MGEEASIDAGMAKYSQRNNVFKSRCSIGGKVCNMIVNSGSMENYIAAHVAQKLELPVTPHPQPYSVGWINNSSAQDITHQCLVKFSFVGYEDSVLCDVINMNTTHLILGIPWQYDVRAIHNCFENKYAFYHDGKKKILCPSKPTPIMETHNEHKTIALVAKIARSLNENHNSKEETLTRGTESKEKMTKVCKSMVARKIQHAFRIYMIRKSEENQLKVDSHDSLEFIGESTNLTTHIDSVIPYSDIIILSTIENNQITDRLDTRMGCHIFPNNAKRVESVYRKSFAMLNTFAYICERRFQEDITIENYFGRIRGRIFSNTERIMLAEVANKFSTYIDIGTVGIQTSSGLLNIDFERQTSSGLFSVYSLQHHFYSTGFTSVHGEKPFAEYAKLRKESLETEFGHALGNYRSSNLSAYYRFGSFLALYSATIISFQLTKLTVWHLVLPDIRSRAVKFRETIIRLGPFYVKLGQALSTRPDILPVVYCQELAKVHDQIHPFPTHLAYFGDQGYTWFNPSELKPFQEKWTNEDVENSAVAPLRELTIHVDRLGNIFKYANRPEAVADAVHRLWQIFKAMFDHRARDIRTMEALCRARKYAVKTSGKFMGITIGAILEVIQDIPTFQLFTIKKLNDATNYATIITSLLEIRDFGSTVFTIQCHKIKCDLETNIADLDQALHRASGENAAFSSSLQERSNMLMKISEEKSQTEGEIKRLKKNLMSCEREIGTLKYELHIASKELEIRNEEKYTSLRSAEIANKQHLVGVKKIAKLDAECQRLRGLVRKKLPGPAALAQMKLEVASLGRVYTEPWSRRSPGKGPIPNMALMPESSLDNVQQCHKQTEFLTSHLLAMEEETKMLKEGLAKRNSELQASRNVCVKTVSKLRSLESQMQVLSQQQNPNSGLNIVRTKNENLQSPNGEPVKVKRNDKSSAGTHMMDSSQIQQQLRHQQHQQLQPNPQQQTTIISVVSNARVYAGNGLEHIRSPEACAAILWKSAKASPKAAEKLKITAPELCKLGICDDIIPELLGGAHADSAWFSQEIKMAVTKAMTLKPDINKC